MCLIYVNKSAQAIDTIIKKWFYKVWIKYIKEEENLCDNIGYLILDKVISHITPSILETFKNNSQYLSFIPLGLTRFIQPLDVVINKPFKEALLKKYIEYCSIDQDINAKITREKMIQFVGEVQYDTSTVLVIFKLL